MNNRKREHYFKKIVDLCKKQHYYKLNQKMIARELDISPSLVSHYFDSMPDLRNEIITYAIDNEILNIVADGLGIRDDIALNADEKLKTRALPLVGGV